MCALKFSAISQNNEKKKRFRYFRLPRFEPESIVFRNWLIFTGRKKQKGLLFTLILNCSKINLFFLLLELKLTHDLILFFIIEWDIQYFSQARVRPTFILAWFKPFILTTDISIVKIDPFFVLPKATKVTFCSTYSSVDNSRNIDCS